MSKLPKDAVVVPQDTSPRRMARVTKLSDDKFNGRHPRKINAGYVAEGIVWQEPIIGQSCVIGSFHTSVVTEVVDTNTFRTLNSTYRIEYL